MVRGFPVECQRDLDNYVYIYSDPDTHEVFYIGMGQGNRAFDHLEEQGDSAKNKKIRSLLRKGKPPVIEILKSGLDRETALIVESAAIDLLSTSKLTNVQSGHHSSRIEVNKLISMYEGEELEPEDVPEKVVCLQVNQYYRFDMTPMEVYDLTRAFWRVDIERANKAKYVFALFHDKIVAVFKPFKWVPAGTTYMAPRPYDGKGPVDKTKKEFIGQYASKSVQKRFKGKSVAKLINLGENPVSYIPSDINEW